MIFNERTISVYRLTKAVDNKSEGYSLVGDITGEILPIGGDDIVLSEGNPAETFKLICDKHEDIKETDKVVLDGNSYIVKTIRDLRFRGLDRINATVHLMR